MKVSLNNSALASQALAPVISSFEQSADGRTLEEVGDKITDVDNSTKLPRKVAKKLAPLRPLGLQLVHPEDSVLGNDSRSPQRGLKTATYQELIENAFQSHWWKSNQVIQVDNKGQRTFIPQPNRDLNDNEFTLTQFNFPLFFGLAIQMYESTLVSDNSPYDQYQDGNPSALTTQQQSGLKLFQDLKCIGCHKGAELTSASVSNVAVSNPNDATTGRIRLRLDGKNNNNPLYFDNGFFNIGVRPTLEGLGVGGKDSLNNPLSETELAKEGKFQQLLGPTPNLTVPANASLSVQGAFKVPGLRNVELTAPYFHNGGYLTLREVVEFYNRGGDFAYNPNGEYPQQNPLSPLPSQKEPGKQLTEDEKVALTAFLTALTDERVRFEKAPFDHPELSVPNGEQGNSKKVVDDGTGLAKDRLLKIPAVGRNGSSSGTPNFLQ